LTPRLPKTAVSGRELTGPFDPVRVRRRAALLRQELQIQPGEDLELRLTHAVVKERELRFDEHVEHRSVLLDDFTDAQAEGDAVGVILEVEDPQRSEEPISRVCLHPVDS